MLEPVELQDLLIAVIAGALVVLSGALYAFCFALARLRQRRWLMHLAYAAYALLAVMVGLLARALHLNGFWLWLVAAMLIGYLLAPHGIWRLCVGTHPAEPNPESPLRRRGMPT